MAEINLDKERELFARCLASPPEQWDAILDAACEGNADVQVRLRRMLDHHTHNEESSFLRLDGSDPERIGPYRVLQRLGEGGMGIVYAAEQREPVRRRVAIKVLRGGYSSREVLARFDVERQALALMSHVNIARILDAGTTPDHRPFIVMEFVPGESITQYCERHDLALRERMRMFCEVCDAVQHAHQRGVIHRDLKPSNILVTEEDGVATPKVIDFGIAKAISQRLTEQTLETRVGSLLGTPDYMSPEQAELSPLDVDTRADVYALGAVLYQLLTGVPPLQLSGTGKSFSEMQRLINEQVPPPPSSRLTGAARRLVRGELDWITMKALEKHRAHRYASADEFARDIKAWLHDGIVSAGPPSRVRRMRKFVRRHWAGVTATATVVVVLAVSQVILLRTNLELAREKERAREEAEIAKRATAFSANLFLNTSPGNTGSKDATAREVLDSGVQTLQRHAAEMNPQVLAALYEAAAHAYRSTNDMDEAARLLELVLQLRQPVRDKDPIGYADTLVNYAQLLQLTGDTERSARLVNEAVEIYRRAGTDNRTWSLTSKTFVAHIWFVQGRHNEAAALLQDALQEADEAGEDEEALASATAMLARTRATQGRFDEAEELLLHAIAIEQRRSDSTTAILRDAKSELASLYLQQGDPRQAIAVLTELVEDVRQAYGTEHPRYATAMNNLARALERQTETMEQAEQLYVEAIRVNGAAMGADHLYTLIMRSNLASFYGLRGEWQRSRDQYIDVLHKLAINAGDAHWRTADAQRGLARALIELGSAQEAEVLLAQAMDAFVAQFGERHWRTGEIHHLVARARQRQGDKTGALPELQLAYEILRESLGSDHPQTREVAAELAALKSAETR